MLRKRGKKCVYTLPRINPRAANLNSTDDAQKLGREIQDDVMEILDYVFNPIPEGEENRIQVCYDGSDITVATQGETMAQVTGKETRSPQSRTTQSE